MIDSWLGLELGYADSTFFVFFVRYIHVSDDKNNL
jgi:hypothetical protein